MTERTVRRVGLAGLVLVVALLYLEFAYLDSRGTIHPNSTALALLLLGSALVAAVCAPNGVISLVQQIESVEALGFKATLSADRATRVSEEVKDIPVDFAAPQDGLTTSRPTTGDPVGDLDEVATVIRARLRFIRDAILGDPPNINEEVMVQRLGALGVLTQDEVRTIADLLGGVRGKIAKWKRPERQRFLDSGWQFGTRLATMVFDRFARLRLRQNGWFLADFEQLHGHRPDFMATKGDAWLLFAARVGAPASTLDRTRDRLGKALAPPHVSARAVVIPDYVTGAQERLAAETVRVIKLQNLLANPELITPAEPAA